VHTEQNRRQLADVFGIRPERAAVVPFGALEIYDDAPMSRAAARTELGLAADEKVLLHFGYIRDYKGLDVLLRALPAICGRVARARLVVAGTPWGGDDGWAKYQRLIDKTGLADRVLLHLGYVPPAKVKVFFRAADLVVLPYRHFEAQSGPGNIALAFGAPLLVTRTGGLPALVRDPGAVVPPDDPDALARAAADILNDPRKLEELSADSKALAREYSWSAIAERTVALYRELGRRVG